MNLEKMAECQYSESNLMLEIVFQYAKSAIQSVILINGMAIISILTFVGNILDKGIMYNKWLIGSTILCFCLGVVGGMLGYCFAYLSQQYFRQIYETNNSADKKGEVCRKLGLIILFISIAFFCGGCFLGVYSIFYNS